MVRASAFQHEDMAQHGRGLRQSVPACVSVSFARKLSNAFLNRFQVYAPLGFETLLLGRQRLLRRCGLEMNA